jgi:SNF2 family DNA or RNA helicase
MQPEHTMLLPNITSENSPAPIFRKTDWQKIDLARLAGKPYAANWGEVGTFKTTTALWDIEDTMKMHPPSGHGPRILIITTKTGKGTYFQTVPYVLPGWSLANVHARDVEWMIGGNDPDAPRIVLAHFHCFTNKSLLRDSLEMVKWDMVLIDEAHRIKNRNAQWSKNIRKAFNGVPFRRVMTGTGFVNTPDEVWALLNFLDRKKWSAYWKFREYFCLEIEVHGFRKVIGIRPNRKNEFRALLADIGVRRTKSEVFKDLLDPITTQLYVELSPTQKRMYGEVVAYLKTLDENGTPITSVNVVSALTRLRQICVATPVITSVEVDPITGKKITHIDLTEPSSKLDALMETLEGFEWDDDRKDSIVIFSQFAKAVTLVEARLQKAGITYLRMLPKHTETQRNNMVNAFQNKEAQVFLSTIDLGGESITLTAAETQINIDKSWSPGKNMQAAGRIHRPGQKGQAQIIDIHAKGTVDDRVQKKLDRSGSWFRMLFGKDGE